MAEVTVRMDGLVSRHQAAELCGVTPEAVTNWVRYGRLRIAKREGNRLFFNLLDVARVDVATRRKAGRDGTPQVTWEIDNEPDGDFSAVLQACWDRAREASAASEPVVYYIRFGDRIKIGTTANLLGRLGNLPHDEVLATEPGSRDVETRRHAQFAGQRIRGEWFRPEPVLMEHIAKLRG